MTEPTPMPPDDRELEQFLARRSELSQRYRTDAEGEGAPPGLDAPVLHLARAELQHLPPQRWQRWGRPLALAASVVLVVSLAWVAQQRPLTQPRPAAPASIEAGAPAPGVPRTVQARSEQALPQQAPASAPASEAAAMAKARRQAQGPAVPPARERLEQQPARFAAPAPATPVDGAAAVYDQAPERRTSAPGAQQADAGAAAAIAAPAPVPMAPDMPAAAPAPAPASSLAARARMADPCAALPARPAPGGDADAEWLDSIRRLRDASDLAGARVQLACFSRSHTPDQVPADLKSLLPGTP